VVTLDKLRAERREEIPRLAERGAHQELLGMKVHAEQALHWYVRDRILREATPL
jgi:hypothetical protein